jgi:hypothetical protein
MPFHAQLAESLGLHDLPAAFERFRVVLASGDSLPTRAADWAGCLVLVERGTVEVGCEAGGTGSFTTGDLIALDWLPLRTLHNPGPDEACLLAVHRRGDPIRAEGETRT